MVTFKIYYGAPKSMVACGVNQVNMLRFACEHKGWHTMGKDRATLRAANGLNRKGYIEIEGDQFRFTYPKINKS